MKEILDKLIESLSNGNILLAVVIVAVALVFNYKKIVEFFEERNRARLIKLSKALECEYIKGLTKSHLEEELATEQFRITTGIRLEKEFREAIIKAHRNTKGELSFLHFRRSLPHLYYKDTVLSVQISNFDIIGYWFNLIFGFILAFLGWLMMVLPSQIKDIEFFQILSILGIGVVFIAIGFFMLYQTVPIFSAKKVLLELEKTHNKKINSDHK